MERATTRRGASRHSFAGPVLALLCAGMAIGVGACGETEPGTPESGDLPGTTARPPETDTGVMDPGERVPMAPEPVLVVERGYWWGDDTRAVEVSADFLNPAARRAVLDPESPIATVDGRDWRLGDILVQVRYRGPDGGATWRVAGPDPVIARYVEELEARPGRTPIENLGVLEMEVRPCCGGGASPDSVPSDGPSPDRPSPGGSR